MKIFTSRSSYRYLCGIILLCSGWVAGCEYQEREEEEIIAEHNGEYLYKSEIETFIPSFLNVDSTRREDSVRLVGQYIEQWKKDRIIADQARKVISNLDQKIEARLERYKYTLINQEYAEWLLDKGLNVRVSGEEVENFYLQNPDKFLSRANYYCPFHFRTSLSNPYKQARWLSSGKPEDLANLRDWAESDSTVMMAKLDSTYITDGNLKVMGEGFWGDISKVKANVPYNYYTKDENGKSLFNSLLMLKVIKVGDLKPLELCREEIRRRIIEIRKQNLIKQGERDLLKSTF